MTNPDKLNQEIGCDEPFIVVDERISPFTTIPKSGVKAIRQSQLDPREISVYVLINMIMDGMIRLGPNPDFPKAIAQFTGLTERQVNNIYKKLADKGLLTIIGDEVQVNG